MRRRLLVGLVALALTLAACGGDDEGGAGGGTEQQQYSLTLIQGVKGDQFYVTMECGAREAAQAAGATLEVAAPDEFDASLQTPVVNAVVAKKPDAILIAPTDTQAMIPPLTQAKAAGIKLVFVDTTTE
ncbi:MAG: substrate-binding domain-containing protein, partial [Thermoleophilia bacterium]